MTTTETPESTETAQGEVSVIYKYVLAPGPNRIEVPEGTRVLCVQAQRGEPQVWMEMPLPTDPPRTQVHHFDLIATGVAWCKKPGEEYVGTFQIADVLVFHVYHRVEST